MSDASPKPTPTHTHEPWAPEDLRILLDETYNAFVLRVFHTLNQHKQVPMWLRDCPMTLVDSDHDVWRYQLLDMQESGPRHGRYFSDTEDLFCYFVRWRMSFRDL